ncbi:MAG: DNA-formamidopyrimidine glycosylase family protein [Pseudomonadota bacterium]
MPEIPDLDVYVDHLERRLEGQPLEQLRIASPFVLRTVEPAPDAFLGRPLRAVRRLAKQLVFEFSDEHFLVLHLMIAGRLQWRESTASTPVTLPKRNGLLALDFTPGTVLVTEPSKKKRASLKLLRGAAALAALDPGGIEVQQVTLDVFAERLKAAPHTLKRALTDQRVFAGIGNAYSDEILHRAQLSPFKPVRNLSPAEIETLYHAIQACLEEWTERLRTASGAKFPAKVTAFQAEMAVHGKYREPCPVCGAPVQRIRYAENEANYCARCQTGGRVLADRSLSRLLKDNWPKRIEDLEG